MTMVLGSTTFLLKKKLRLEFKARVLVPGSLSRGKTLGTEGIKKLKFPGGLDGKASAYNAGDRV